MHPANRAQKPAIRAQNPANVRKSGFLVEGFCRSSHVCGKNMLYSDTLACLFGRKHLPPFRVKSLSHSHIDIVSKALMHTWQTLCRNRFQLARRNKCPWGLAQPLIKGLKWFVPWHPTWMHLNLMPKWRIFSGFCITLAPLDHSYVGMVLLFDFTNCSCIYLLNAIIREAFKYGPMSLHELLLPGDC